MKIRPTIRPTISSIKQGSETVMNEEDKDKFCKEYQEIWLIMSSILQTNEIINDFQDLQNKEIDRLLTRLEKMLFSNDEDGLS